MTIFKNLGASIGDPWFNYFLAAIALGLVTLIAVRFNRLRKDVLHANSQIERVDGMDDEAFAQYISAILIREGWEVQAGPSGSAGALLYLEQNGKKVMMVLHTGRRRLTREYMSAVLAMCTEHPHPGGQADRWCFTNTSFTSQARQEGSRSGFHLVDRRGIMKRLAKSAATPIIPNPVRKR